MKVEVRHTANIISVCEVIGEVVNVFKTWHEADFTERKLKKLSEKRTDLKSKRGKNNENTKEDQNSAL